MRTLLRHESDFLRFLVVEDEGALNDLISLTLRYEEWGVCSVRDDRSLAQLVRQGVADAVVLDLMRPTGRMLALLTQVRDMLPTVPMLALVVDTADTAQVRQLAGAHISVLAHPFTLEQVVGCARSLLPPVPSAASAQDDSTST